MIIFVWDEPYEGGCDGFFGFLGAVFAILMPFAIVNTWLLMPQFVAKEATTTAYAVEIYTFLISMIAVSFLMSLISKSFIKIYVVMAVVSSTLTILSGIIMEHGFKTRYLGVIALVLLLGSLPSLLFWLIARGISVVVTFIRKMNDEDQDKNEDRKHIRIENKAFYTISVIGYIAIEILLFYKFGVWTY